MAAFSQYRLKAQHNTEMTPWTADTDMTRVTVTGEDKAAGHPKAGDMVARKAYDPANIWLVTADYLEANFEAVPA